MKKGYKILLIILAMVIILIIIGIIAFKNIEARLNKLMEMEMPQINLSSVKDGTYTGEYRSFPVMAKVRVKADNNEIVSVELLDYRHGQNMKLDELPERIIKAQSLQVDVVSGATMTSRTVLLAVDNALKGESDKW